MSLSLTQQLIFIAPLLVLSVGAFSLLMAEVFVKGAANAGTSENDGASFSLSDSLAIFTLLVAGAALLLTWGEHGKSIAGSLTLFSGIVYIDSFSWFFTALLVGGALLTALMGAQALSAEGVEARSEYYSLYVMSVAGAIIFVSSAELITLFLGLEIMSMGLYCLCGSSIAKKGTAMRRSSESALKYFLLGSFSSAFLLYGISILYGLTGSTFISVVAEQASTVDPTMLYFALGMMLIGVAFKLGAVPFHFWTPDVYQGAPTPVTAFMACVVKCAAVGAGLRVFWGVFNHEIIFWSGAVWFIAVITMVVGNLVALRQRSVKRMLAFSSIAHAGYLLLGFLAPGDRFGGGASIFFYLVSYLVSTLGAFGVLMAVCSSRSTSEQHPDDITHFNGLAKRRPLLAILMGLFMLSLAGLPPGMAGLFGKFYIFSAAVKAGYTGAAIIGVLTAAVSAYYYLRVIVAMFFVEGEGQGERHTAIGVSMGAALAFCALAVVLLGIFPDVLYEPAARMIDIKN